MKLHRLAALALMGMLGLSGVCPAEEAGTNMIGRQSQNEGISVLPASGKIAIDGKLDEWDLSGRIWVFADKNVRGRYSTEVSAMWTATDLYVAVKWKDPTPMFNMIDPEFNPNDGWKADSVQLRLSTADQTSWLTTWYFTGKKQPVLHVSKWKEARNARSGQDARLLAAEPGGTSLGEGAEMAYRDDADGQGFVQEIKIPWSIIYATPPEMKAGVSFHMGMEFLWGDPTGKVFPIHRYADNMQPGKTSREFYWTATADWGDATLLDKGKVPVRTYVQAGSKLEGTVPVRLTLPRSAGLFTVVIEDANGKRIRSMGGLDPADYTVAEKGDMREVELLWDGLTDEVWSGDYRNGYKGVGALVPAGTYTVRGLYHNGLSSTYEMCYYNPGTPPWAVVNGSGAWGADHAQPLRVAAAGDWMIASWGFAEGGSGLIGIGPDGLKKWGEKRGGKFVAADAEFVYAIPAGWHLKNEVVIRLNKKTGAYAPFMRDGKALPFEMPIADILQGNAVGTVTGIAVQGDRLALTLLAQDPAATVSNPEDLEQGEAVKTQAGFIAIVDRGTAQLQKVIAVTSPASPAIDSQGNLYALVGGKAARVDLAAGTTSMVSTPGVEQATALTCDLDGNILVADMGADKQVKAYSPVGKMIYSCGKKGGRPIRGAFDNQAMMAVKSVAVDSTGSVWVTESWDFPRRVSVWGRDGKLVRDYIGNTGYAGTGSYLHDQDPTLAYVGPIEMKLDKATKSWQVTQILWVPDAAKGESFEIKTGSHTQPQRFRSDVSGKMREYLYAHDARDGGGNVVYMEHNSKWQPVAAVCLAGHVSGGFGHKGGIVDKPSGEMAGLDSYDGIFWSDGNGDGIVQRSECDIVEATQPGSVNKKGEYKAGKAAIELDNGWGGRMGRDLVFYVNGLARVAPIGFAASGAPIYTQKSLQPMKEDNRGDLVPVPEEHRLICLSTKGYAGPTELVGVDTRTGEVQWSYPNPYPGVHGSHRATMPKPGLLIGPLKTLGVVEVNAKVGRIFAMRGNLGQDFFMTTDGVFIGTMFEDGRLPGMTLPSKEEQLNGVPMEGFSNGGEPFNGCLVRHDDGKVRMTTGFAREAAMILQVNGLDSIERFAAKPIAIDTQLLARIDADNLKRAAAAAKEGEKAYVIKKMEGEIKIDGRDNEWKDIPKAELSRVGSPNSGTAQLAYDADKLYLLYQVQDGSTWKNEGKDFSRLFKTGDAVDLQLSPTANTAHDPKEGDFRIVIGTVDRKPTAVLMRPKSRNGAGTKKTYTSPVGSKTFDEVVVISGAEVKVSTGSGSYTVEAAIPFAAIGIGAGGKLTGDFGFISSDAEGMINTARTYWANKQTNLVNDEPIEAWLDPQEWGKVEFE